MTHRCHIGTAGWSVPRATAAAFPGEDGQLARYARVLNCVEINSSFHRSHRTEVYARWASQTPGDFRFAVKLPSAITHEGRLRRARGALEQFMTEASGLGDRLGVVLVQLPPSLIFEPRSASNFFDILASMFKGFVVCEPRHASWFEAKADRLLIAARVGRVAADPARWPAAATPGGWLGPSGDGAGAVLYYRWHGSPRTYWSSYDDCWLSERATERQRWSPQADCYCIFDNTASGAAAANALRYHSILGAEGRLPT